MSDIGPMVSSFAINMLQRINKPEENVCFSPASITIALGMTLAGATGRTRAQILNILSTSQDEFATHRAFANFIKVLLTADQPYQLHMANRLYMQSDFNVQDGFKQTLAMQYQSDFKQVNFRVEETRIGINKWVAGITRNKVNDIIPVGGLNPRICIASVNAIYFKGKWAEQFEQTKNEKFYVSSTREDSVKMMYHAFNKCMYGKGKDYQAISLPYLGGSLRMLVILPNKRNGLDSLEKDMTGQSLIELMSEMRENAVEVWMPKFAVKSVYRLQDTLKKLGLVDMFVPGRAEFNKIALGNLYVSNVFHQALIEVDEEGTVAAAATVVTTGYMSLCVFEPPEYISFKAEHPFMYAIMHNGLGCPLFFGHCAKP